MGWRARVAVVLILLAAAAPVAIADEMQEPVHLDYRAAAGCPDEAFFEARVQERTARARFVGASGRGRTFDVRLEGAGPSVGHLTVSRGGVVEGSRELDGSSCEEVADGLALAVALAVDPAARMTPAAPSASSAAPVAAPTAPSATSSASAAPPTPAPAATPPTIAFEPAPSAATAAEAPAPTRAPRARGARGVRALSVGADLALATGVTPQTLLGVSPFFGWRATGRARIEPSVRLSFVRAASGTLQVTGGAAAFTWTVGRLDGCAGTAPSLSVRLLACARVEGGVLEATGSQVPAPQQRTRAWFAAGPVARAVTHQRRREARG